MTSEDIIWLRTETKLIEANPFVDLRTHKKTIHRNKKLRPDGLEIPHYWNFIATLGKIFSTVLRFWTKSETPLLEFYCNFKKDFLHGFAIFWQVFSSRDLSALRFFNLIVLKIFPFSTCSMPDFGDCTSSYLASNVSNSSINCLIWLSIAAIWASFAIVERCSWLDILQRYCFMSRFECSKCTEILYCNCLEWMYRVWNCKPLYDAPARNYYY